MVTATATEQPRATRLSADLVISLVLAAGLVLLAFVTTGAGLDQSITVSSADTWAEIALTVLGAGACAAMLLLGARGRAWGGATVALFLALTVLTALSIAWSVQPDNSWQASNLTLAYLATFAAAAALARILPGRWRALVGAVAITTIVLCAYALLTKVFPSASNIYGRLQAPLGYWNATGLAGALGLGPCLWAWNSRELNSTVRGLTVPGGRDPDRGRRAVLLALGAARRGRRRRVLARDRAAPVAERPAARVRRRRGGGDRGLGAIKTVADQATTSRSPLSDPPATPTVWCCSWPSSRSPPPGSRSPAPESA